jgi:hypothetical protein
MDPAQFDMFNKTSPYITNRILTGNELPLAKFYDYSNYVNKIDYKPLFMDGIVSQPANSGENNPYTQDF